MFGKLRRGSGERRESRVIAIARQDGFVVGRELESEIRRTSSARKYLHDGHARRLPLRHRRVLRAPDRAHRALAPPPVGRRGGAQLAVHQAELHVVHALLGVLVEERLQDARLLLPGRVDRDAVAAPLPQPPLEVGPVPALGLALRGRDRAFSGSIGRESAVSARALVAPGSWGRPRPCRSGRWWRARRTAGRRSRRSCSSGAVVLYVHHWVKSKVDCRP